MRMTHSERTLSRDLEAGAVGIGDELREPIMVAQVDEQEAAVVAQRCIQPERRASVPMSEGRNAPQVCER